MHVHVCDNGLAIQITGIIYTYVASYIYIVLMSLACLQNLPFPCIGHACKSILNISPASLIYSKRRRYTHYTCNAHIIISYIILCICMVIMNYNIQQIM